MTVRQWVDAYKNFYPNKGIRIIDSQTGKGTDKHWLEHADCEYLLSKITTKWIFLYI